MKTKFSGILTLLLAFVVQLSFAQDKTISGTVLDDTGLPLPGTTVLVKGTSNGTSTDFDGNYSIQANTGDVLVYSFVGYSSKEVTVGGSNTINVTLVEDAEALEEVVVTALGIKKEQRQLAYGTSQVKAAELTRAREANITNSLQGKVTGVQITNSGGNLGGSSKVIIRGVSSLSGRNNPLWIVDGVMINDSQTVSGDANRITGNRDFANGASVINPDDVESINVLKGAAATALYGSRASAGAIVVTTKRGKEGAGPTVSINSSFRFDNLFRTPDYQQEYAGGTAGRFNAGWGADWGPRIAGQTEENLAITGATGPLTAVKDNGVGHYFQTGQTAINNFAISDGSEKYDYRLSVTNLDQQGVLPGAELDRITVSLNSGVRHSEKLESRFNVQYTKTKTRGTGASGANDPNIFSLSSFSSTVDPRNYIPWKDASGNQINKLSDNQGIESNNPYWLRYENSNNRDDDRVFGNFEITYKPWKDFAFTGRVGADMLDDRRLIENSKGTVGRLQGDFVSDEIRRFEVTSDFIANYNKNLSEDLNLNVVVGSQYNQRIFQRQTITGVNLLIPELFSPSNAAQVIAERDYAESRVIGLYGSAELDYKNFLTLTVTGRNDWSSTLPKDNNNYFYPSVGAAFVFTDAFNLESNWLSFGKLRASWAQVGNDTAPYQLDFRFLPEVTADGQYGLDLNFPMNGALAYRATTTIPPEGLRPEQQTSYEVGLEMKFFQGRLGFDFSYFNTRNEDQILNVPIPESTGFGFNTQNVGRVDNKGFEIALDAIPVQAGDFTWRTNINWSKVEQEVVSLTSGVERITIASGFSSVQVIAEPGKPFQLSAIPYLKDEATGRPIIDPSTGRRQAGAVQSFGSVLPDWTAGWVNNFSYKGFNLSATIDAKWGGVMKSSTVEDLQQQGLVTETLRNREGSFIDTAGVLDNGDGTFRENDVPVLNAEDFWANSLDGNGGNVSEPYIFDASFVKFRELAISYTFNNRQLGEGFLQGLTVGIEGRNLALLYSKVPHIDPEASLFGSGADGFGVERASVPSTRSVGFNVRLTF
ncbi:SusC/RagA family TonB-linked outer membrane protein [Algibacter mikhailovii]|uniref:SusC/RagA family TonB-linked outer membrane protein n=1 Tax=Algibacter mikhailovii TaxID=425498 RepID=A0A918V7N1_9FLAO|nr:SusC/RagA family TonB-linked outer membrane protein [Algibacter mikhailovii]GGZ79201.1 SusC/RagA family TonB-linked outer membrane protein [Algibacter mikhailovii]